MPMRACGPASSMSPRSFPAPACSTGNSPQSSRRSARRRRTPPALPFCAISSKRPNAPASSPASSSGTASPADCRWRRRPDHKRKEASMKAVLLTGHGGPEMLRYGDAPDPVAQPSEVVVDVYAASVNAADYKVRLGSYDSKLKFPYILGRDFSGVVAARGTAVTDLAVGAAVFGVCDAGIEGCYAEKVAIKAAIIAKKPDLLTHAQAAAMALTSLTAIWALEDTAQLKAGETILIQGGAGGVAGFAIQLAKHMGARVITTASANNHDYVRALGATRAIDYNKEDFT